MQHWPPRLVVPATAHLKSPGRRTSGYQTCFTCGVIQAFQTSDAKKTKQRSIQKHTSRWMCRKCSSSNSGEPSTGLCSKGVTSAPNVWNLWLGQKGVSEESQTSLSQLLCCQLQNTHKNFNAISKSEDNVDKLPSLILTSNYLRRFTTNLEKCTNK